MAEKVTKTEKAKQRRGATIAVVPKVTYVARRAKGRAAGFMTFVREQGVVGLAVGLAIGTQAADFVKVIVASIITPLLDLMVGKGGLAGVKWTVHAGENMGTFTFGSLIDAALRFLAVAFVIYFVVKGLKLDRLDKKKEAA